ncbi:MAG: sulfite exporter TauE/SafE family protein [Hyphomicrobiales bacterium]|nr:sulfite exporter TauE/SafE family protein [Hyphomicrobiales bacterium]
MDSFLSHADLAWLVAALIAGGLVTGVLAGLFGVGGGGILVPVLYELFRVIEVEESARMHLAVATSLAIIIPTSLRSFRSHHKRGAVDMAVIRALGPPVAVGVLLGAAIAAFVDGWFLKLVYVVSAVTLSVKFLAGGDRWRLSSDLPGEPVNSAVGAVIGAISTLIGIGGGVYVSSYMALFGRPIHQAVATSSGFGPIIAVPAVIGYVIAGWNAPDLPPASLGYVSLIGAAIVAPMSVLAAPIGVCIAHGASRRTLEIAFGVFLAAVATRFAIDLAF